MAEATFTEAAIDDLRRIGPDAVPKVLKKVLILLENVESGHPLGGDLTGYRKLVVGRNTWRIVYRVTAEKSVEICEIWAIGARADAEIYLEAVGRLRAAGSDRPGLAELAKVVERLGQLAGDLPFAQEKPREPVPGWLAGRPSRVHRGYGPRRRGSARSPASRRHLGRIHVPPTMSAGHIRSPSAPTA